MNGSINILIILGSIQGFLLSFALAFKKKKDPALIIHVILLLILSIDMLLYFIYLNSNDSQLLYLKFIIQIMTFSYGPLFYLFTSFKTLARKKFTQKYLLHFIPFIIYMVYTSLFFLLTEIEKNQYYINLSEGRLSMIDIVLDSFLYIHLLIYSILSLNRISRYSKNLQYFFSNLHKINLQWLKIITTIFSVCCFISLIAYCLFFFYSNISLHIEKIIYLIISSLFYVTGYFAINQPEIFSKNSQLTEIMQQISPDRPIETFETKGLRRDHKEKYIKTKLDDAKIDLYLQQIIEYTEQKRPYLDSMLNMQKFSEELNIPSHCISQVINTRLNQNFYQYINHYRVEDAKKYLSDPHKKDLTILDIAFEVGFNSKSTFNAIFKKMTQMTPSEFRKRISQQNTTGSGSKIKKKII